MLPDQSVLFATGTALLVIGAASIALSRNLVKSMMSFQVAVFGANLSLFAAGLSWANETIPDTFVLISIIVGAGVEAVGLSIVVLAHRKYGSLDPDAIRRLKK